MKLCHFWIVQSKKSTRFTEFDKFGLYDPIIDLTAQGGVRAIATCHPHDGHAHYLSDSTESKQLNGHDLVSPRY